MLKKKDEEAKKPNAIVHPKVELDMNMHLDKSLASCMDSFDTLFCRRCLVLTLTSFLIILLFCEIWITIC